MKRLFIIITFFLTIFGTAFPKSWKSMYVTDKFQTLFIPKNVENKLYDKPTDSITWWFNYNHNDYFGGKMKYSPSKTISVYFCDYLSDVNDIVDFTYTGKERYDNLDTNYDVWSWTFSKGDLDQVGLGSMDYQASFYRNLVNYKNNETFRYVVVFISDGIAKNEIIYDFVNDNFIKVTKVVLTTEDALISLFERNK